eukprot:g3714.t1
MRKGALNHKQKKTRKANGINGEFELSQTRDAHVMGSICDRKWLKIDNQGNTQIDTIYRHKLIHELGVQPRDLRVIDPRFSTNYPSAILCRENSIVVNLLWIKAILTTEYVLLASSSEPDERMELFISELKSKLSGRDMEQSSQLQVLGQLNGRQNAVIENELTQIPAVVTTDTPEAQLVGNFTVDRSADGADVLPFELKALEICLEFTCKFLYDAAIELEGTAYPAGDDLAKKVNNKNLQRVRLAKSKIVQLTTTVETIKEILEKLLDDDEDMKTMNLSAKLQTNRMTMNSPTHSRSEINSCAALPTHHRQKQSNVVHSKSSSSSSSSSSSIDEDVQEVEMLLEAYFLQLDHTFNRLQALNEYIDSAEDLIIIEQDNQRNQLLQLELKITTGALALNIVATIAAIFGMNLDNKLDDGSPIPFWTVTILSFAFASLIFLGIIMCCRFKDLM